jgi:hypothetical protein
MQLIIHSLLDIQLIYQKIAPHATDIKNRLRTLRAGPLNNAVEIQAFKKI